MPKVRISVRGLLLLTGLVAAGCAAMVKPSYLAAGFVFTIAMVGLGYGVIAIALRHGASRAFWIGFCVFGWGHMLLALGPWFEATTGELIITRQSLDMMAPRFGYTVPHSVTTKGVWEDELGWLAFERTRPGYRTYIIAGQSLFTVLIALVGGFAAHYFYLAKAVSEKD